MTTLSPYHFRQVLGNLSAFSTESALRQIEEHRRVGDFDARDCDRLANAVRAGRAWMAV